MVRSMGRRPGRSRPGGVTISDVAEAAGVSRATVSRVVNERPSVQPEIAERVRAVIVELGYNPSRVAQSLSLGKTQTVGVVVPDLGNPTFQSILHGVNQAAATAGYRVLVADSEESADEERALVEDVRRRTDAVILCSPRMRPSDLDAVLPQIKPVVVVNRDQPAHATRVVVDYAGGISAMCRHLISLGHRRILHLDGPVGSNAQAARALGLATVAFEHPEVSIQRVPCGSTIDAGYAAYEAARGSGATAVIGFNDLVALGLLGHAREEGWRVPGGRVHRGLRRHPVRALRDPGADDHACRVRVGRRGRVECAAEPAPRRRRRRPALLHAGRGRPRQHRARPGRLTAAHPLAVPAMSDTPGTHGR